MKIERKLIKKSGTYPVRGKSLQDAKNALGSTDWGRFQPIAGKATPTLDKSGKVVSVELRVGHSIEMPVWSGYKAAPKVCRAEWDRMWKALEKHEQEHALVYLESVMAFENELSAVEPGTIDVAGLAKVTAKFMADMESSQDEFEHATDRGRKRGVFLDPPGECT